MNSEWLALKELVTVLPRRDDDTIEKLAARMVLLASAGRRVSLFAEGHPDFCRYLLAWSDSRVRYNADQTTFVTIQPAFWGQVAGRTITGWNGLVVARTILEAWPTRLFSEPVPETQRAA